MELINIEVAYAIPKLQKIISLKLPINTSIYQAIILSKINNYFPQLDSLMQQIMQHNFQDIPIGIFGKKINPQSYMLQDHDRIEIYRPLTKTPNQKRLERAQLK